MVKKIALGLLLLIQVHYTSSMEKAIDYNEFFACSREGLFNVKEFIKENPTLNINYQNTYGETAMLYAAGWNCWDIVWYLIDECHANKNIKDNYGQSVFSKLVYFASLDFFKQSLQKYSLEEINALCKKMPLDRNEIYEEVYCVNPLVKDVLQKKQDLESKGRQDYTALHYACLNKHIPLIVKLLKRGASLEIKNKQNKTPYDLLLQGEKRPLFAVREALNNGPCMPTAIINDIFEQHHIVPDAAQLIKQLYVKVSQNPFEAPEACIWKPVCVKACALAGMGDSDESRCLTRILLLPQREKTELNIKLLLDTL